MLKLSPLHFPFVMFYRSQILSSLRIDSSTGASVDDMEKLEKQAQTLAEQAKKNQAKPKRDVLFVRYGYRAHGCPNT
jgi:hypothetical protein